VLTYKEAFPQFFATGTPAELLPPKKCRDIIQRRREAHIKKAMSIAQSLELNPGSIEILVIDTRVPNHVDDADGDSAQPPSVPIVRDVAKRRDNMWDRNWMRMLPSLWGNLNTLEVVGELADMMIDILVKMRAKPVDPLVVLEGEVERITDFTGVEMASDGSPIYKLSVKPHIGISLGVGGFHVLLKLYNIQGALFGDALIRPAIASYRSTEGLANWVIKPGNPNQVKLEIRQWVQATFVAAVNGFKSEYHATPRDEAEVYKFMLARAEVCPLAHLIIIWLMWTELITGLEATEHDGGDPDSFSCMEPLAQMFAILANSRQYVCLLVADRIRHLISSEAQRVIRKKASFVKKTNTGDTVFTDRFVEWSQKEMRALVTSPPPFAQQRCILALVLFYPFLWWFASLQRNNPTVR
jgi:hypothetical protein